MIRYLHLDTEMGGRELNYSLLQAYFLVTDDQFKVLGELSLNVKPDDGIYILSGQGMNVNQIDIKEHDRIAMPYKSAKTTLFNFLKEQTEGGKHKLIPLGHGVRGDIEHVIDKLISEGSWEGFCTYHYIDTSVVLQFLRALKLLPQDQDGSVGALGAYFGIIGDGLQQAGRGPCELGDFDFHTIYRKEQLHNPKVDAIVTMRIYREFLKLVIGKL